MIRYFICENCHQGYEADDMGNTNCPFCHSDNVRPAKKKSGVVGYIALVFVFVASCAIGFIVPKVIMGDFGFKSADVVMDYSGYTSGGYEDVAFPVVAEPEVPVVNENAVPVITEVSTPKMVGETYSFKVTVNVPSGDKFRVYLYEEFSTTAINVSADGNFHGVAPIKGGVYKVVAENAETGELSSEKFVNGCIPIEKVVKLTEAEMQASFNTGNVPNKAFMARFTSNPKITVVGMEEGEQAVSNVGEIYNRIGAGYWLSVQVSNVKYAIDNRVSAFTITITY